MATRYHKVVSDRHRDAEKLMEAVTACGKPDDATLVYSGRRNKLFYINPGADCGKDTTNPLPFPVNVKAFRIPPFPNGYVYRTFRASKARRSYVNGLRLLDMGFLTPEPIGYSEIHTGIRFHGDSGIWPRMTRSYYFCEQIPYPNMRGWEGRSDVESLLKAFGAEIARIHAAGIWFHDFSPGNIMVETTPEGEYKFYYVDLNRMDFDIHDPKKLIQMFKTISWEDKWTARIAEAYAVAAGKDPTSTVAAAIDVAHRWREGHTKKERLKEYIKKLRSKEAEK